MARTGIGARLAALSGIAFVGLLVASIIVSDPNRDATQPVSPTQPAATLAQVLAARQDATRLGAHLGLLSIVALLWFLAALRRHLARAEGEDGWLAAAAHGGGLVLAGVLTAGVGYQLAMGVLRDYGSDPAVAKTLVVLTWDHLAVVAAPVAVLVGATSAASLCCAALPRWLGWGGVPVALVLLSPTFVTGAVGYLAGLLGFFGWTLATAVVLARRR